MQSSDQHLRYVILHHTGFGEPHYDLMFESAPGSTLMTWRATDWPLAEGDEITPISDHRREYLAYEGPLTNNRGQVRRIATGTCEISSTPSQFTLNLLSPDPQLILLAHLHENHWRVVEVGP
jgi:hypothetical protein